MPVIIFQKNKDQGTHYAVKIQNIVDIIIDFMLSNKQVSSKFSLDRHLSYILRK